MPAGLTAADDNDTALPAMALARADTDNGNRTDLNDFIAELGLTDQVAAPDEDDD